jgi:YHS domain-containing protein
MMLIELFVQKGALTQEQRLRISEALITDLMSVDNAPPDMLERGRAMSHVVVIESDALVGGRPRDPSAPPHYTVRATVPAGHMNDAMRAETVSRITHTLARFDHDPQRLYHEASAWVHIIETPDGNMGAFGQIVRIGDIMQIVLNSDFRPTAPAVASEGTVVDPICGMTVALTDAAITLELGGTTHAFCSAACRDIFARQQPVSH